MVIQITIQLSVQKLPKPRLFNTVKVLVQLVYWSAKVETISGIFCAKTKLGKIGDFSRIRFDVRVFFLVVFSVNGVF